MYQINYGLSRGSKDLSNNFRAFFFGVVSDSLSRMEIIPQVTEAFVSGVAIGALVFAAMVFTVMLAQIIAQAVEIGE